MVLPATGNITCIYEWEMAGFWPVWWEYRKALYGGRYRRWWLNIVQQIMPVYPVETEVDMNLNQHWDNFLMATVTDL